MARRSLKPPVEELSPEAWQRIEARVFERLDASPPPERAELEPRSIDRQRWLPLSLAAAALAASVFAVVVATSPPESPRAGPAAQHPATGARAGRERAGDEAREESSAARAGSATPRGSRIATTTGPATTTLGESVLAIANHSELRIEGDDARGWLVLLDAGSVHFDVAPRGRRPDFVVRAGDVIVRVVGTRFDVTHGEGQTRVAVQEGRVRVESEHGPELLGPGDFWSDGRNQARDVGAPAAGPDPAPVKVTPGSREKAAARAARAPATSSARGRTEQHARADFERAARLERVDPAEARRIYQKLAHGAGPWAANALYAEARLLMDRGEREASRRLLRRYLNRYPKGANAPDVSQLLSAEGAVESEP